MVEPVKNKNKKPKDKKPSIARNTYRRYGAPGCKPIVT